MSFEKPTQNAQPDKNYAVSAQSMKETINKLKEK